MIYNTDQISVTSQDMYPIKRSSISAGFMIYNTDQRYVTLKLPLKSPPLLYFIINTMTIHDPTITI